MESQKERFWRLRNPLVWGLAATLVVVAIAVIFAFLPACYQADRGYLTCPTKWFYLKQSTPNELGDTLAGFSGALAFIWIIVTVALQSKELAAQREELSLARVELKGQRKATENMAAALAAQAKVFEDEQRQRVDDRNRQYFEQTVQSICVTLNETAKLAIWKLWNDGEEYDTVAGKANYEHINLMPDIEGLHSIDEIIRMVAHHWVNLSEDFNTQLENWEHIQKLPVFFRDHLLKEFKSLASQVEKLSPDQKLRFINMRAHIALENLELLAALDVWDHEKPDWMDKDV